MGLDGRDGEVPELSATVPYDPFKTDMFIIGNLFKHKFFLVSKNPHSSAVALIQYALQKLECRLLTTTDYGANTDWPRKKARRQGCSTDMERGEAQRVVSQSCPETPRTWGWCPPNRGLRCYSFPPTRFAALTSIHPRTSLVIPRLILISQTLLSSSWYRNNESFYSCGVIEWGKSTKVPLVVARTLCQGPFPIETRCV